MSIFAQTIFDWNKLNREEKRKALQAYEHELAELYGRMEREIRFNPDENSTTSYYDQNMPEYLFISNPELNNTTSQAFYQLQSAFHEGFHAFLHDCATRKAELKSFIHIDIDHLVGRRAYIDYMANQTLQFMLFPLSNDISEHFHSVSKYEEFCTRYESIVFSTFKLLETLKQFKLNLAEQLKIFIEYFKLVCEFMNYQRLLDSFRFKSIFEMTIERIERTTAESEMRSIIAKMGDLYLSHDRVIKLSEEDRTKSKKLFSNLPKRYVNNACDEIIKRAETYSSNDNLNSIVDLVTDFANNMP